MNKEIIQSFYHAFQQKNADDMVKYYADDVIFHDPAFGELRGENAGAMWKMLCSSAKDLKIEFEIISAEEDRVEAKWEAYYTFSQTGRKVHNIIYASFKMDKGLIKEHTDHFDLHKWATQAMGWKGRLLGGTKFFQRKLNAQTAKMLERYKETARS